MKRIKKKKSDSSKAKTNRPSNKQAGGLAPIDNTATKAPLMNMKANPYYKPEARGGNYWEHRDPNQDSKLENKLEYIPGIGNVLSVNDWMDATQNMWENPSWRNFGNMGLETLSLIPFGNILASMGKGAGKKLAAKAARAGKAADISTSVASDETLQMGGIVDPLGQWAHPGMVTTIPGNQITMQGVNYPVMGVSNSGDKKLMMPGQDYTFDGTQVTEYPMKNKLKKAQNGTGLAGPVLRSGPNVKNSLPPVPTVTVAPNPYTANRGSSAFSLAHGGKVRHNWQTPMYGWGQIGLNTPQAPPDFNWAGNQYPNPNGPQIPVNNPNQVVPPDPLTEQQTSSRKFGVGQLPTNPAQLSYPFYSGNYYLDKSVWSGQRAKDFRNSADAYEQAGDPLQARLERRSATGNDLISVGSGIQAVSHGAYNLAGTIGSFMQEGQNRQLEAEQFLTNNRRNRARVNPYAGDNTQPAFTKHGGYVIPYGLPSFQIGGMPTEGTDFLSGDPNVITEIGETITDPTKGPAGAVVKDTTGDAHSDPSGGNSYKLGPDSVVHSKALGIKVGEFLSQIQGRPDAGFITAKVTKKYPDPNKEVSYADLAGVFDTKLLAKEIEKLTKKGENINKKDLGNQATPITQVTQNLNKQTLSRQITEKTEEVATNVAAAGSQGPIHNISEALKSSGAYGTKVKTEQQQIASGNPPTADKGLNMKGKKVLLPKAQSGTRIYKGRRVIKNQMFDPTLQLPPDPGIPASLPTDEQFYADPAMVTPGQTTTSPVVQPTQQVTQAPDQQVYDAAGNYFNTGYNSTNPQGLDRLFPNLTGYNADQNIANIKSGRLYPIGNFTDKPTIYNQPLRGQGNYGNSYTWGDLVNLPERAYYRQYANDYIAEQKFGKDWDSLTGAERSQVANWEPLTKDKSGKWKMDNDYVKYHQERYNKAFSDEYGYDYYDAKGDPKRTPWAIDSKSGEITSNEPLFVRKSFGAGDKAFEIAKNEPVIYVNEDTGKVETKPAAPDVKIPGANVQPGTQSAKKIYQEGLAPEQIAGDLAGLFMGRDPVPYIENQGAKDALAASTRQQFDNDWAARNAIQRQLKAATQYQPQNNQPFNAQMAANAWTAQNELSAQQSAKNAQIQQRYEDMQNQLRMAAGANKAQALDTLAQRTATARWKKSALDVNSLSNIAMKRMQNRLENRTAGLYQGMFKNAAYDPFTGTYIGSTEGYVPTIGSADQSTQLLAQGYDPIDVYRIQHGQELLSKGQMEEQRGNWYARRAQAPVTRQTGGKVKRIPSRMKKSK